MKNYTYLGNSAYCYSNSVAMLLATIGENILPSYIEAVGGVGIGAYSLPNTNICFLSGYSGLPDKSITRSLTTLGFEFKEEAKDNPNFTPYEEIRNIINSSPVILGPLDMHYLVYNPESSSLSGVDHFILVFDIDDKVAHLHDPAGFPNVTVSLDNLTLAWRAEKIQYKEGYFRYWALPKKVSSPTAEEIYNKSIENFKNIYITGEKYAKEKNIAVDSEAIILMAENIKKEKLQSFEISMLNSFVFPLGARRTSDYSIFFKPYNNTLSDLKAEESSLLGLCQSSSVENNWKLVANTLKNISEIEKRFKMLLFNL